MKKEKSLPPLDLTKLDAKLRAWRKKYNTPAKIAALHRKAIQKHVVQSMAFENDPVSKTRLKTILGNRKKT